MSSPVYEAIRTKRAIRHFRDEPLPEDVVERILNAGRLSGSAKNMQPWHFIAVRNRDTLRALSECGRFAGHLAGAALGVALATFDPFYRLTVPFDLGRAAQNMMLTAWELGVGSVMATMYRPDRARDILQAPPDVTIPWCISFGYPADADHRSPAAKGGRRPAADVIHYEKW
ncbi:MAG TPA: nitroreductase family protein [Aggregatilineales bacterium]|nr:nitroreductase [Chloroflexota bacterium]HOA25059.1 nitroreductase family protein [Aggregatilineales bacterium]HPV06338.1 nitroreductase family protein [Aggregatilineales bacterium]HQA67576.1 nitroreductase family protein [Aggregatilineales bacterium]HQE19795.1 nitroreductase family protein [Aggregatilineales bacterium]